MRCVAVPRGRALTVLALATIGAWALTFAFGGASVIVPHAYYLPVMFGAVRFGWRGGLATALVSGVLAGPATWQSAATATPQTVSEWVTRLVFFVLIGQVVAWMLDHTLRSVNDDCALATAERELGAGLRAGELSVRYQPVVDLRDGAMAGAEALVRWDHPDGERGPDRFLPTAEQTGLIHDVGAFVLAEACRQAERWRRIAVDAGVAPPAVPVNAPAAELVADDLTARVGAELDATGLPARLLCLEVTEGALITDLDLTARHLRELRDLGVAIALDDFGTGYSSLSYLHRFPVDLLKIDRSFVNELQASSRAHAMVGAIIRMCRELGIEPLAEGVESAAQVTTLRQLGCRYVQGFHIARPERAELATAHLRPATADVVRGSGHGPRER